MKKTLSVITLLAFVGISLPSTANSQAGAKPKCRVGQIAVLENNAWTCKAATIKAPTKDTRAVPNSGKSFQATTPTKPKRKSIKPDLVIYAVGSSLDATDNYHVKTVIRNNGASKSGSAILDVRNMANGQHASASIPALNPGSTVQLNVKFAKPIKKGENLRFRADSKNHVDESNEGNNKKDAFY